MLPPAFIKITPEDFDAGFVEFPISYRRGEPPAGWPTQIRLRVPDRKIVDGLVELFKECKDPFIFVRACVPEERRDDRFLGSLAYDCENALLDACYTLTFGEKLKNQIYESCMPVAGAPERSLSA